MNTFFSYLFHLSAGLRLEIVICLGQKSCSNNKSFILMLGNFYCHIVYLFHR